MKPIDGNDRDRGPGRPGRRRGDMESPPCRPALPGTDEEKDSAIPSRPTDEAGSQLELEGSGRPVETIGPFEIERLLERNEGWAIYWATDPRFERDALIKVAEGGTFPTAEAENRFQQETVAARILSHTSIVPVLGSGHCDAGAYVVYERCPGITLDQWLSEQPEPIDPKSAAELVQCLADAVQHAHQRDMVHRGLNPFNILIDRCEEDPLRWTPPQVRINNFGMGHAALEAEAQGQKGRAADAWAYRSPEQRRGDAEVGPASDVYSLGAILYRLLTGQLPPRAKEVACQGQADPQSWDWGPHPSALDPGIQSICCKCLSDSPTDRYSTAFELADELIYCYQGRPNRGLKKRLRWPR